MRLKTGEENRSRFIDADVMFFVNAYPEIKIAGDLEIKHERFRDCGGPVDFNIETAKPELVVLDGDRVAFVDTDGEDVIHS